VETVADDLARRRPRHLVCDPVMLSKTGFPLLEDDAVDAVITRLIPLATVVTPNVHEAERLAGLPVGDERAAEAAGRKIRDLGAEAVLVKGGHLAAAPATDVLVTETGTVTLPGERIDTEHTHGTGCMLSAAIATHLARGFGLEEAVRASKVFLTAAIRAGFAVGGGVSPPDPFFAWRGAVRPSGPGRS
jgi:hydroxymethylpyrimidine/phosphomethylpyrimidine kinase